MRRRERSAAAAAVPDETREEEEDEEHGAGGEDAHGAREEDDDENFEDVPPAQQGEPQASKNAAIQVVPATKNKGNQAKVSKRSRKQQTEKKPSRVCNLQRETCSEAQVIAFTGVSFKFLELLSLRLGSKVKDSYKLSRQDKIQLVFVKLKLNVSFRVLSAMFSVSLSHTTTTFARTLDIIFQDIKDLVCWFSKKRVQKRMPACFKGLFPHARVIVDATEVPCEKPSSKRMDIQLYSHYKGRHTVKFLVGIAPSGEITFLSKASGGRTTDTELTVKSGLLQLIEPGDVILADKGFPRIETDVNVRGGILVMPPLASGERQFSSTENEQGFQCATVRIHVERAIRRMKQFKILHFLPIHMFQYVDKILVLIAFVCNCYNDLIKQ